MGRVLSIAEQVILYWRWLGLCLVLILAAGMELIGLNQEGYANTYYAAGVKSMLTSWHNFFFVSFDSGGFVSLDKPPLGLWIETASAKLFGFSGLSMLAPEALAGILSVALLYHLVARVFGSSAGLLAALVLALNPISVIIDRNNTIDSLLILTLLLGVWAISVATERAQLRWVLLAALVVGLAFNIKMLQAYLVVPAFGAVYLLGARLPWRIRLLHLVLAASVLLVVSFCWVAIVDSTPASQRPFVSDSGTNSMLSLALGYNGLGRLTQALFPGLTRLTIFGDPIDLTIVPAFAPQIGDPGLLRLVGPALGGQASWFLLPALAGLIAIARLERPRLPLARRGQSLLLWGGWLLMAGWFFSTARFFHLYYLVMIAPPIAALAGIGLTSLWHEYRRTVEPGRWPAWRGWLLPATLLGTALVQASFLNGYPDWASLLAMLVIGGCLIAALVLVAGRLRLVLRLSPVLSVRVTPPGALACLLIGVAALLMAPTTWAVAAISNGEGGAWLPQAGTSMSSFGGRPGGGFGQGRGGGMPFAPGSGALRLSGGPGGFQPNGGPGNMPLAGRRGGFLFPADQGGGRFGAGQGGGRFGGGNGAMTFAGAQVPTLDPKLVRYLQKQQGNVRYLVATTTSSYASLFILATGQPVMALGGYQGWDRILSPTRLAQLVANGTVRFFYLPAANPHAGPGARTFPGAPQTTTGQDLAGVNNDLTNWVHSSCALVPTQSWQTLPASPTTARSGFESGGALRLYDCAGRTQGR